MPTHSATVTAVVGAGKSITSAVFKNIKSMTLVPDRKILSFSDGNVTTDIDLNAVTTFTVSISGGSYTLTIS